MAKFKCTVCGWIYDEAKGVPGKFEPGTSFESLPDDFRCPCCGAMKKWFKPANGQEETPDACKTD